MGSKGGSVLFCKTLYKGMTLLYNMSMKEASVDSNEPIRNQYKITTCQNRPYCE